jgi:hypothetical protein
MIRRPEQDEFAALDAHIRGLRADATRTLADQINVQDRLERVLHSFRDPGTPARPEDIPQGEGNQ